MVEAEFPEDVVLVQEKALSTQGLLDLTLPAF